jgi:hypothetical protein
VQDQPPHSPLAELKPEKLERAAVRWHGRLQTEAPYLSLAESQLALAALASLCVRERDAIRGDAAARKRSAGSAQLRLRARNWSHVAEPRITPRTSLHPPSARGGNMYAQRSHRTSAVGATP